MPNYNSGKAKQIRAQSMYESVDGDAEHTKEFSVVIEFENDSVQLFNDSIITCYFMEDIFLPQMIGRLSFIDRHSLVEKGPLTGSENIYITCGREEKRTYGFCINNIESINQISDTPNAGNQNVVDLTLVEDLYNRLTKAKYAKSWNNQKGSTIIKDICKNMLGITDFKQFEETNENITFNMTNDMRPIDTIRHIIKRCSGSESGQPGYLLYSNNKGINFVTLEKLLSSKDKEENNYVFHDPNPEYINTILSSRREGINKNVLEQLAGGKLIAYDPKTNQRIEKIFNYKKSLEKFTVLGNKSLFTDISTENSDFQKVTERDPKKIENMYYNNWIKKYCLQGIIRIVCRGNIERYCGRIIEIEWPSNNSEEGFDKTMQGKCLIQSIVHQFDKGDPKYKQELVLIKNGFDDADSKSLLPSSKKNTSTIKRLGK